jgi:hypothetical protein
MVLEPFPEAPASDRLEKLRSALASEHRAASLEAFTPAEKGLLRTGLGELDRALGGGFPRGVIATLEGPAGSGRSAVAARLLANATALGLGALVESPQGGDGALHPLALAAAGVDLERLLVVHAGDATAVARAADILMRAAAFDTVVIPAVALRAAAWTRLAGLTHRANALLLALTLTGTGGNASDELRYFASVRVRMTPSAVRWSGEGGLFCALAGIEADAAILKHKRAAPGKHARVACDTLERSGAPLARTTLREVKCPSSAPTFLTTASQSRA